MVNKNLDASSTPHRQKTSDSSSELTSSNTNISINSFSSLKRRLSATKMLSKAKENTKSLVHEVLDKRHSLDSKRSDNNIIIAQQHNQSTASLNSLEKLKMPSSVSISTDNLMDDTKLSSRPKQYSLPIRRPFTIRKSKTASQDSSLSSDSSTNSSLLSPPPLNAAEVAEANVLAGSAEPGSFATACDFRLANEKRNEEFHALFKSVQETDMLIQDYKCALQKDILLQGHFYVSEHHVCFKSNIFGWVTNLVISFDDIIEIEKKMTARIIPNGITITTATTKHVFASFLSRDQAYDQIIKIWNLSKRASAVVPDTYDYYHRETDDENGSIDSTIQNSPPLLITDQEKMPSDATIPVISSNNSTSTAMTAKTARGMTDSFNLKNEPFSNRPRAASDSFRERRTPTEPKSDTSVSRRDEVHDLLTPIKKTRVCPCTVKGEQYLRVALNETYNGSVEAMYKLLFDSSFSKKFLERFENFQDVHIGSWKHGSREVIGKRKIKSSTMGTRLVKILFQEKRIHRKFPYYLCVTAKKSMPDMPMGAVYSIQSRTCITRVNKEQVHVLVTFQIAFSKSGLVSSIIEKNAADDQMRQYSHLNSILQKPDLMRELVKDDQLLQDLHIKTKSQENQLQSPKSWTGRVLQKMSSLHLLNIVSIGLFVVLLTHCLLALRLKRITHHLESVQQQQYYSEDTKDVQWMNARMQLAQQQLSQLQSEANDFDQRLSRLKNVQ